jgi:hypothetical protein
MRDLKSQRILTGSCDRLHERSARSSRRGGTSPLFIKKTSRTPYYGRTRQTDGAQPYQLDAFLVLP